MREKDVFAELRRTPLSLKSLCASSSPSLSGSQVLRYKTSSQTKAAHGLRTPCSENVSVQATSHTRAFNSPSPHLLPSFPEHPFFCSGPASSTHKVSKKQIAEFSRGGPYSVGTDTGARETRASPALGLPAVWPWASDLSALSFSFLIYKLERL